MKKIRPLIEWDGQKYVDEAVYEVVSKPDPVAALVNNLVPKLAKKQHVFGKAEKTQSIPPMPLQDISDFSHYSRVPLRWMTPKDGKLVPRG
jgi:hypothetical protein